MRRLPPLLMLFVCGVAAGEAPPLRVLDPEKRYGYVVGETLQRVVELDLPSPDVLATGSLPLVGSQRNGIELHALDIVPRGTAQGTHYRLTYTYQVFTRGDTVREVALPAGRLETARGLRLAVPGWRFAVSPLAAGKRYSIERAVAALKRPLPVQDGPWRWGLLLGLAMMLAAFAGLTWINADRAWFPGMGGPFARCYRRLEALPETDSGLMQGIVALHAAFRATFGENLLPHRLEEFLDRHPRYMALRGDIARYLDAAEHHLYGVSVRERLDWRALREFNRRCRDCEREAA